MYPCQPSKKREDNIAPEAENSLVLREDVAGEWEIINAELELPGDTKSGLAATNLSRDSWWHIEQRDEAIKQ